jgi:zinc/manganese transport system substrate-binding protein
MKRMLWIALAALLPSAGEARLNVVATIPDFGAIAEEIGGDKVKVTSIGKGTEDIHFIEARPSYVRVLNQADVLIESGVELEVGWLPPLLNNARNRKIVPDAKGNIDASRGIETLDKPQALDRSTGDVHPRGNPHYTLDPANGKIIAKTIAEAFSRLDPKNAGLYEANRKRFDERLDRKIEEWSSKLAPYRGTRVATYHKSLDYFLARFGLEVAGTIEPKPGIEPSPGHINSLIPKLREQGVKLVLVETFRPRRTPEYVAQTIGAKLVVVAPAVGGNERAGDYISLFDYNVDQIVSAVKESR